MGNTKLSTAKAAKKDEFFTQWRDIESEMMAYWVYDKNVFKDKTILLPCDDPEWSQFTRFFARNFEQYGIKKLISTSYAPASNPAVNEHRPGVDELASEKYDPTKSWERGRKFVLERGVDLTGDGQIDIDDLQWEYLEGDGDFRSEEVTALRDEADMVITNSPFSLFREFVAWVMEGEVQFSIIGNMNAVTYKEIFPLIKDNKLWPGTAFNKTMEFAVPADYYAAEDAELDKYGNRLVKVPAIAWYTNIEHGVRHEKMQLMTMADNLMYSRRKKIREQGYPEYDNYDAIEVAFTEAIPSDHEGVMGVPISFLGKYNPEQFEIVGTTNSNDEDNVLRTRWYSSEEKRDAYFERFGRKGTYDLNAAGVVNGAKVYGRILIRHKR